MRWPVTITLPRLFGWSSLAFGDRLKLMGFLAQAGAGVAMTAFAGYAMIKLAELKAVWPVFYLGAMAMILVGIVVTGFAGMLIVRTLEVRGPGGFVFKSQDAQSAQTALEGMNNAQSLQSDNKQDIRGNDDSAGAGVRASADQQERGDQ